MSKFTKLERQYVKGIVQNLSLQRFSDKEIVHWFREEKQIELDRSTISKIRTQGKNEAESWYIGLRDSTTESIAFYKDRLDSLYSYQKKIHETVNQHGDKSPELVLKAMSELHRIELSLHTLMKELPGNITTSKDLAEKEKQQESKPKTVETFKEWKQRRYESALFPEDENDPNLIQKYIDEQEEGAAEDPEPVSLAWAGDTEEETEIETQAHRQLATDDGNNDTVQSNIVQESTLDNTDSDSDETMITTAIEGPGIKHELGIHCTQCHRIYFKTSDYNEHECMKQIKRFA